MLNHSSPLVRKVWSRSGSREAAPVLAFPYLPYLPHLIPPCTRTHRYTHARTRTRICTSILVWKVWKVWKNRTVKGLQASIPRRLGLEGTEL